MKLSEDRRMPDYLTHELLAELREGWETRLNELYAPTVSEVMAALLTRIAALETQVAELAARLDKQDGDGK